jgi:hypothetical protein
MQLILCLYNSMLFMRVGDHFSLRGPFLAQNGDMDGTASPFWGKCPLFSEGVCFFYNIFPHKNVENYPILGTFLGTCPLFAVTRGDAKYFLLKIGGFNRGGSVGSEWGHLGDILKFSLIFKPSIPLMQVPYYNTFSREAIFRCQGLAVDGKGILQHILMGLSRG